MHAPVSTAPISDYARQAAAAARAKVAQQHEHHYTRTWAGDRTASTWADAAHLQPGDRICAGDVTMPVLAVTARTVTRATRTFPHPGSWITVKTRVDVGGGRLRVKFLHLRATDHVELRPAAPTPAYATSEH